MAASDILNPTATDTLSPDYGMGENPPQARPIFSEFRPQAGAPLKRVIGVLGRVYDLQWQRRSTADMHRMKQWESQFEMGYFTFVDYIRTRYFSGRFAALKYQLIGNEAWNISGQFEELAGLPLSTYPTNWSRDGIFVDERDDFGSDTLKLAGTWTYAANANAHGGADYTNAGTVTTDTAEWIYWGYGFQLYSLTANDHGQIEVSLDGAVQATVDLYTSGTIPSAAVLTVSAVALGLHRMKLRATNTKNASSSAFKIRADAIRVMR